LAEKRGFQFILATHSPILMGIENAKLLQITNEQIETIAFEETEHYKILHQFLTNRQAFIGENFLQNHG
jgi:predicted ATPase